MFTKPLVLFNSFRKKEGVQIHLPLYLRGGVFLHKNRRKDQVHVRTQRRGTQKCVCSFPQAHARSQKRVSWYQLTPTHKMASVRLYSNSETPSICKRMGEAISSKNAKKRCLGLPGFTPPACFCLERNPNEIMKMHLTPHPYGSVEEPAAVTDCFVSRSKGGLLTFKGRCRPSLFALPISHVFLQ